VSYSPALKWSFFVLLLLTTLGWKLAVQFSASDSEEENVYLKVADFLVRQHFTVSVSKKLEEGEPAIRATAGTCRILVSQGTFEGWHRERIERYATPADAVFVVFDGKIYTQQPTWLTVPNYLWAKFRRELGLRVNAKPVFFVIAPKSCAAERLPWGELG
jgi:hypothetical protein